MEMETSLLGIFDRRHPRLWFLMLVWLARWRDPRFSINDGSLGTKLDIWPPGSPDMATHAKFNPRCVSTMVKIIGPRLSVISVEPFLQEPRLRSFPKIWHALH